MKPIYLHVITEYDEGETFNEFHLSCKSDPKFAHVIAKTSVRVDVCQIPEEELTKWMRNFVHAYWRLSGSDEELIMEVIDWAKFREILGQRVHRADEYKQNKRSNKPDHLDQDAITFIYNFCSEIEDQHDWKLFPVIDNWSLDGDE
jgi:hypothetical protein